MVCRLHKALDGLKQAPRAQYERLHKYIVKIGFEKIDIALFVGIVARFFANPRENHSVAVKRIMRYLKGT